MTKYPWERDYGKPSPSPSGDGKPGGMPWERSYTYASQPRRTSEFESFLSGAGDALTFGWGDELLGRAAGLGDLLGLSGLWGGLTGDEVTEQSRLQQKRANYDNPGWYLGGQFGGGLAGGIAAGGLGALATGGRLAQMGSNIGIAGRMLTSGATGALGGAAYGAGSANDEQDMGQMALTNAIFGGALGAGARGLGALAGHAWREGVKPTLSSGYRAAKELAEMGERYGQTPMELHKAAAEAAPNATMMDVVTGGPELVKAAGVRPSAERVKFREMLDERNNAMPDDAADMLWDAAKVKRIDAGRRINELEDAMSKISYDDIDAATKIDQSMPEIKNGPIAWVMHQLEQPNARFKGAVQDALEHVKTLGGTPAVGDKQWQYHLMGMPQFWRKLMTSVREDAQGAWKAAKKSGVGKSEAREGLVQMSDLRKGVSKIFEGTEWEARQSQYAALANESSRINRGYEFVKNTLNTGGDIKLGKFMSWFGRLGEADKEFTRQGAVAALEDVLNSTPNSGRADALRRILGTKSKVNVLNNILGTVKKDGGIDMRTKFAKMLPRLEQQQQYFRNSVESGIGVNSHTAPLEAAKDSLVARTNPMSGSRGVIDALWKLVTGKKADQFDEAVSNHILSYMSRNPQGLLDEIDSVGGVDNWVKAVSGMSQMTGGLIGNAGASLPRRAAIQARKMRDFRRNHFDDALISDFYMGSIGGAALPNDDYGY